jgi:hypothetical protein
MTGGPWVHSVLDSHALNKDTLNKQEARYLPGLFCLVSHRTHSLHHGTHQILGTADPIPFIT